MGPPDPARTTFQLVVGTGPPFVEAKWTLVRDSPIVTSWAFMGWELAAPPARAAAARSMVAGAILAGTRQPAHGSRAALRTMSLLTHELTLVAASDFAHQLDSVSAFDVVYALEDDWLAALPQLISKMTDVNLMRLGAASFVETENYATRGAVIPPELDYLHTTTVGQLAFADADDGVIPPATSSLSRATVLLGSKDTRAERADESSWLRVSAERIRIVLLRVLHATDRKSVV